MEKSEREKDELVSNYENQVEVLKYKLLNKIESTDSSSDSTSSAFTELLSLAHGDLQQVVEKLKNVGPGSDQAE